MLFTSISAGLIFIRPGSKSHVYPPDRGKTHKKYELQEFERTLELITRAENVKETTSEMKAELTYLKAQAHESLGQQKIANTLYEYLAEEHKNSQYGYLASKKLNQKL